jgi:hypothetical protein
MQEFNMHPYEASLSHLTSDKILFNYEEIQTNNLDSQRDCGCPGSVQIKTWRLTEVSLPLTTQHICNNEHAGTT